MKANNAAAKNFQSKVADEIIPALRKQGFYALPASDPRSLLTPTLLRQIADRIEKYKVGRTWVLNQKYAGKGYTLRARGAHGNVALN